MPRKPEPIRDDRQSPLFDDVPPPPVAGGHVHAAAMRSIDAARRRSLHDDVDEVLGEAITASALALDRALAARNPSYAVAQLIGPFRELLEAGSMTPAVRESTIDDELRSALDAIAEPTADDPAAIHDTEDTR